MNIKLTNIELNASLDEETMVGLSGGLTPNPLDDYPRGPIRWPRPPLPDPWKQLKPDLSRLVRLRSRLARRRVRR